MSRLYAWIISDTRKTTLTTRANQTLTLEVNYGSKHNSKRALIVQVEYKKGDVKPTIWINYETLKNCLTLENKVRQK